jgi:hypothetical protein
MTKQECIETLTQRRDYLEIRIAGKSKMGWETQWDEREHDALSWALEELGKDYQL